MPTNCILLTAAVPHGVAKCIKSFSRKEEMVDTVSLLQSHKESNQRQETENIV